MAANPKFNDWLANRSGIPAQDAKALAARHSRDGMELLLALAAKHPKRIDDLGRAWGDSLGVAYVPPDRTLVQPEAVKRLSRTMAEKHGALPIYEMNYVVTVATSTPENRDVGNILEPLMDRHVSLVFAFPHQIQAAIEVAYVEAGELASMLGGEDGFGRLGELSREKAVKEFARGLLLLALRERASDVHLEPMEDDVRIRFRKDGVLQEAMRIGLDALPTLTNHLKILAEVDIAENRKPQDGRITLSAGSREIDVRMSCVPTIYGTKTVMRLLGQNAFAAVPEMEELSFSKSVLDDMGKILASPNGIFFITGPTGSGKTTTLFAALKRLNQSGINVMTVEDPVEYRLPGLNQVQVNPAAGVTFASAMRAFLRQDPNVILIGEIRDPETATIAAQAALTGHLVMATMHTNSALQAVTRLIQIGVEPFLVAPSLIGVMAQRLVRRLCDNCKERRELAPAEIQRYFEWDGTTRVGFCRPVGCERCGGTGFQGRLAIHELFVIDEQTRELIARGASILDIQRHARERGYRSMRYDGYKKVLRGLTTPEEVDRAMVEPE